MAADWRREPGGDQEGDREPGVSGEPQPGEPTRVGGGGAGARPVSVAAALESQQCPPEMVEGNSAVCA